MRKCETCGNKIQAFKPRKRVEGKLVCDGCANGRRGLDEPRTPKSDPLASRKRASTPWDGESTRKWASTPWSRQATTTVTKARCPQCQREREIPHYMSVSKMRCPYDNTPMEGVWEDVKTSAGQLDEEARVARLMPFLEYGPNYNRNVKASMDDYFLWKERNLAAFAERALLQAEVRAGFITFEEFQAATAAIKDAARGDKGLEQWRKELNAPTRPCGACRHIRSNHEGPGNWGSCGSCDCVAFVPSAKDDPHPKSSARGDGDLEECPRCHQKFPNMTAHIMEDHMGYGRVAVADDIDSDWCAGCGHSKDAHPVAVGGNFVATSPALEGKGCNACGCMKYRDKPIGSATSMDEPETLACILPSGHIASADAYVNSLGIRLATDKAKALEIARKANGTRISD